MSLEENKDEVLEIALDKIYENCKDLQPRIKKAVTYLINRYKDAYALRNPQQKEKQTKRLWVVLRDLKTPLKDLVEEIERLEPIENS